jgi:CO/xanthine dehydrogenase Mo-binding subunit
VHGVEVEVELETGHVLLKRVSAVHDPGRAINPKQVQGQIEGAIVQAMGWTLLEDFVIQKAVTISDRLSTYLIPTVQDIPPEIKTILIETPDPIGPFGVRGVGEIAFVPLAPAVVCAVRDATGVWFSHLPLKAEDLLRGLYPEIFSNSN